MIDNVVYERSVPECAKIGYLQQQKIQKNVPLSSVRSPPHSKILGTPLLCPCTRNEKSAPLHLCVVSRCVYTVGFILWVLQKCMVICSVVVRVKSCLGLDLKVLVLVLVLKFSVLVLVLVLRPRVLVLVLVLTKKSYLHHCWKLTQSPNRLHIVKKYY